jgi:hypothetical protein
MAIRRRASRCRLAPCTARTRMGVESGRLVQRSQMPPREGWMLIPPGGGWVCPNALAKSHAQKAGVAHALCEVAHPKKSRPAVSLFADSDRSTASWSVQALGLLEQLGGLLLCNA